MFDVGFKKNRISKNKNFSSCGMAEYEACFI